MLNKITILTQAFILFFAVNFTFGINPPKNGKFPKTFWRKINADKNLVKYRDPGWMKKMEARKELREKMSLGKVPNKVFNSDHFIIPVLLANYSDKPGIKSVQKVQTNLFGNNLLVKNMKYHQQYVFNRN